ncbi:MAG TPA: hypothetical protein VFA52_04250 [Candidatus Paceibacterota bacterium]|jgi:hypothetical protein|nr:hypothetical protein [Candidatus Paceibacterota bacterium]
MKVEVVKKVKTIPPAHKLSVLSADGTLSTVDITWEKLRFSPIGEKWSAKGVGMTWNEMLTATLVYRDEHQAVILESREYLQEGHDAHYEHCLLGFVF